MSTRLKKEMNGFPADTDGRRLRWSLLASLVVTALGLGLLGLMLRPRPTRIAPEPRLPLLIAVRLAPPAPKPKVAHPAPKPRPVTVHHPRSRPRLFVRPATLRAPSARRNRRPTPHPTPPGGSPSSAPALATPSAAPTVAPQPPAHVSVILSHNSPIIIPENQTPSVPFDTATIPTQPFGVPNGSGSGTGQGAGGGMGTGSGEGQGAGAGSGGLFGLGSEGTGNGEGPRHIAYVLDISGSMASRIDQAREELREALAGLQPGESFDIIVFSDDVRHFSGGMTPATRPMIQQADYFLSTLQMGGGTNLEGALRQALRLPDVNMVYVVTDGVPTGDDVDDTKKYMADFPRRVQGWNRNKARIYTVGLVGKDPDGKDESFEAAGMLTQIARDSGGKYKIVAVGDAAPR